MNKNKENLLDFIKYCLDHPEERFWQALRNWSGFDFITATRGDWNCDTFYWIEKDEFSKSVDEE